MHTFWHLNGPISYTLNFFCIVILIHIWLLYCSSNPKDFSCELNIGWDCSFYYSMLKVFPSQMWLYSLSQCFSKSFKYQKNALVPFLVSSLPKWSTQPKTKRIFEIVWGKLEIIHFFLSDMRYVHGWPWTGP